jgi:hypothetical protein
MGESIFYYIGEDKKIALPTLVNLFGNEPYQIGHNNS